MARRLKSLWPQGGLWRHPDFLRLWAGQTISQFGSQISALALPIAAIVVLDATAFQVALLGTVEFLPFLLFTLPAGVWVDRLRRRPILVIADLVRAAVLVSRAGRVRTRRAHDLAAVRRRLRRRDADGVLRRRVPVLSPLARPPETSSWRATRSSSSACRPPSSADRPTAGGLVSLLSAPWAVLTDAISFLGSALFVLRIRKREEVVERPPAAERPGMRAEVWEGLRFVWQDAAAAGAHRRAR